MEALRLCSRDRAPALKLSSAAKQLIHDFSGCPACVRGRQQQIFGHASCVASLLTGCGKPGIRLCTCLLATAAIGHACKLAVRIAPGLHDHQSGLGEHIFRTASFELAVATR